MPWCIVTASSSSTLLSVSAILFVRDGGNLDLRTVEVGGDGGEAKIYIPVLIDGAK